MSRPDDRSKELEQLRRQHGKLDAQVHALETQRWVSPRDEQEIRRLKRAKLAAKDRMRQLQPNA